MALAVDRDLDVLRAMRMRTRLRRGLQLVIVKR
jgi:hypothetical protein